MDQNWYARSNKVGQQQDSIHTKSEKIAKSFRELVFRLALYAPEPAFRWRAERIIIPVDVADDLNIS